MAVIRATCGDCGDVELSQKDVVVVKLHSEVTQQTHLSYAFNCPCCNFRHTKEADDLKVMILEAAGCRSIERKFKPESLDRFSPDSQEHLTMIDSVLDALRPSTNGDSRLINSINTYLSIGSSNIPNSNSPKGIEPLSRGLSL